MTLAYVNGQYLPLAEAKVSVLDRGFLFGDGVYEVIPVYKHNYLFRATEHLTRLDNSLEAIDLPSPLSHDEWLKIFDRLLQEPHAESCSIYLQITRGADTKRAHVFPDPAVKPTVVAFLNQASIKSKAETAKGLKVATHEDIRWSFCFIKAITLLPNVLMLEHAKQQGLDEAILLREGYLTEACASNVFIVKNGTIFTTPKSEYILGGITREYILEVLEKHNLRYEETEISADELYDADEIWLTSSTKEIAPVIELDDNIIGDGKAGAMWSKVYDLYHQHLLEDANHE